jgi:hypothetical protein
MAKAIYNNEALIEYLLGSLPDEKVELFDEWSITDDEFANSLEIAENELVDRYVRGELTGLELSKFRAAYLSSTDGRLKVDFAQTFLDFSEKSSAREANSSMQPASASSIRLHKFLPSNIFNVPRWMQLSIASAAIVLLAIGLLGYYNLRRSRQISDKRVAAEAGKQNQQDVQTNIDKAKDQVAGIPSGSQQVDQEKEPKEKQQAAQTQQIFKKRSDNSIASFVLMPQVRGTGQFSTFSLPVNTTLVAITIQLEPNDYSTYRVALMTESSRVLWRSNKMKVQEKATGKILNVSFPARLLAPEVFVLQVYGVDGSKSEALSAYPFKVVE